MCNGEVILTKTSIIQFGTHEQKEHMGIDNFSSKVPNILAIDGGMLSNRCRDDPRYCFICKDAMPRDVIDQNYCSLLLNNLKL